MRKIFSLLLAALMALTLCAPSLAEADNLLTPEVLDALVELQPMGVLEANVVRSGISDYLQAIVKNDTQIVIESALIAFAAWDEAGQPVKIEGLYSFGGSAYAAQVKFDDINVAAGATYGENSGLQLKSGLGIASCRAIVVSYDGADGAHWENPYFLNWCEMYEEKPFDENRSVSVPASADELSAARALVAERQAALAAMPTTEEMLAEIDKQPVHVTNTVCSPGASSSLWHGDLLQAILKNDSTETIKSAVVAFVAWDANGQPAKIIPPMEIESYDRDYTLALVSYDDINMAAGGSYGNNNGYEVDPKLGITQFKALVYSYETASGETWDNPLRDQWIETFKGKPLAVEGAAPEE